MSENIYHKIKHAGKEELLEAAIVAYTEGYKAMAYTEGKGYDPHLRALIERCMRIGFALAQEDGWEQVAPAWLRDYRKEKE